MWRTRGSWNPAVQGLLGTLSSSHVYGLPSYVCTLMSPNPLDWDPNKNKFVECL